MLKAGGNAVDAAVAAAATLGVTEPYSAGIGGGGYFVYYNAKSGKVRTLDGRETAPMKMPQDAFIDPATGKPYTFTPDLVTSGASVGTPGTLATWDKALGNWGTWSLGEALAPATKVARRGFKVDETFRQQTLDNEVRFAAFKDSKKLFLPKGDAPKIGSIFRNPELADTYDLIAQRGTKAFYRGKLARLMSEVVRKPRTTKNTDLPVPAGWLTARDLRDYKVRSQRAAKTSYRGHDVYGMAPSSSRRHDRRRGAQHPRALRPLGDDAASRRSTTTSRPARWPTPTAASTSATRPSSTSRPSGSSTTGSPPSAPARSTRRRQRPSRSPAGDVTSYDGVCTAASSAKGTTDADTENISTTNLTVADQWGNVVEYTLTIEQTGGSGMVVPGHGFLLNNELTDFSTVYDAADPNRIQPGKRPRSSMSPTIVLKDGKPFLALGSPGGSTIITTVLQMLVNRIDLGMTIEEAIAAPRATQRNTANVTAEPAFIATYGPALTALGHTLVPAGDAFTSAAEIGAATAIELGPRNRMTAVAEPSRRGKGSAKVVDAR